MTASRANRNSAAESVRNLVGTSECNKKPRRSGVLCMKHDGCDQNLYWPETPNRFTSLLYSPNSTWRVLSDRPIFGVSGMMRV